MPQMNKGGKFISGKSLIRENGIVQFPAQVIRKYSITAEGKACLFNYLKTLRSYDHVRFDTSFPAKRIFKMRRYKVTEYNMIKAENGDRLSDFAEARQNEADGF